MSSERKTPEREALDSQRGELLAHISRGLETPMTLLAFVWLVLMIVELTRGLTPFLTLISYVIWGLFAAQFVLELVLAPNKRAYLRDNWLTALALVAPAFRVLVVFRVVRVLRGLRLLRVVSSVNRGMRSLGLMIGRRGWYLGADVCELVGRDQLVWFELRQIGDESRVQAHAAVFDAGFLWL